MAETTTGVTISQLSKATTLQSTDSFELERNGAGYSVTYGSMVNALKESLGILELNEALTEIIVCTRYIRHWISRMLLRK